LLLPALGDLVIDRLFVPAELLLVLGLGGGLRLRQRLRPDLLVADRDTPGDQAEDHHHAQQRPHRDPALEQPAPLGPEQVHDRTSCATGWPSCPAGVTGTITDSSTCRA